MRDLEVGLIGCGHISSAHLRGWSKTSASRVTRVFDLDRDAANRVAQKYGVGQVAETVDQLIDECDVIDICTPPQVHRQQLEQALGAGRHVLIEKPVVLSADEWSSVSELLSESDRKLAVVHHLKFVDSVMRARRWVEGGRIGRVLRLHFLFMTSPSHDRMLTSSRHWSQPIPGGRWAETLPHNLYLIHMFAGALDLSSLTALSTPDKPEGLSADEVSVTFGTKDRIATVQFSAHCHLNERSATIIGTHGAIRLDLLSGLATLHRLGDSRLTRVLGRSMLEATAQIGRSLSSRPSTLLRRLRGWTPHATLIRSFERHLLGQGPAPTPREEIDYVVRMNEEVGQEMDRQLGR